MKTWGASSSDRLYAVTAFDRIMASERQTLGRRVDREMRRFS